MSATVTEEEKFKDWEPYNKLVEILSKEGVARIYFVATSCGMSSPNRTAMKLQNFASGKRGLRYTDLTSEEWRGQGKSRIIKTPALTALVNSTNAFIKLWCDAAKIRSSGCGCSVFISDGQEVDVRVMPKAYTAGDDTRGRYLTNEEVYE